MFDLAGSVDGFLRATEGVPGLEFLSDLQEDRVDADDDFYYEATGEVTDEAVPQSLYMVMTNAQAVTELVRLFGLWQNDPTITFERGLNPLKDVFGLLRSVRRWGPEDRVRETGLLEQWEEDVAVVGSQGFARVEVELWFRSDPATRTTAESQVVEIIESGGGAVISRSEQSAVAYHAVLADIPMDQVATVLADGPGAIQLLTTESIMMVGASRPMAFPASEPVPGEGLRIDTALPTGPPRVALLDGVPLANHTALSGRLTIDDPDDRTSRYTARQRNHCSAMSSLIIYGDLSAPGPAIEQPLYIRPVLEPHEFFPRVEVVPPDKLLVDIVHAAFHRIFEGDGPNEPAAPSVRVLNLSVGDPARAFVRRLSPLARLLDWLAYKYNLVIVVSAGNPTIQPVVAAADLEDPDSTSAALARSLHDHARHRRLYSPAEAINVVTAGALHDDAADIDLPDNVLDLVPAGGPASYSPVGFGFRRSVKPELLVPGGRQVFLAPPPTSSGDIELEAAETTSTGPGLCVAAPGLAGELDAISFSYGTSNAAALTTRTVSRIFDVLEALTHEAGTFPFPDPQYHPVLAKTLLVHATGWHTLRNDLRHRLGLDGNETRRELTRLLGYGPLRPERVATADRVRVVLLGAGSITKDQRHTFQFPLPPALSATTMWRRLTITLAWLSPTNVRSQKYRQARLWYTAPRDELAIAPLEADHNAVLKGTIQHQVLEGEAAVAFVDGTNLTIDVDCRSDAGALTGHVRYGLAASLEVSNTIQIDLHEQVRSRLREQARAAARAQIPAR